MTWMKYIQTEYWKLEKTKVHSEDEIIERFNDLFKNELVREAKPNAPHNPYKGIGYIVVSRLEDGSFIVKDDHDYLSSYYIGIYGGKDEILCLNLKAKGLNTSYFKFTKESDDYIPIIKIIRGVSTSNQNIIRLINILFMREQPYFENYDRKDIAFNDYSKEEKELIINQCKAYGRREE